MPFLMEGQTGNYIHMEGIKGGLTKGYERLSFIIGLNVPQQNVI